MSESELIDTAVGSCSLRRSNRKTLGISVLPNGSIELTAPRNAPLQDILKKVAKRARWIDRHRAIFAQMNATRAPRRYCSGATHYYLGKQYRLKIIQSSQAEVRLRGGYFHIKTPTRSDPKAIESQLDLWYRAQAKKQFQRRLSSWSDWCQRHGLPPPRLVLRSMPKRWGSAQTDGRIFLNPELVRVPSVCIDYVITHEICHLLQPDHSHRFYESLSRLLPNWRAIKDRLERHDQ